MTGLNLTYSRYSDPQINYTLKTLTSENSTEKACRDYRHVFQYKDHLGNVRMTYSDLNKDGKIDPDNEILSQKNYYPFGGVQKGYNNVVNSNSNNVAELFSYNGKELEEDLGLEFFDFGARRFDPEIARWTSVDPMAEFMRRWSPFTYAFNNPIKYIDPDGMRPLPVNKKYKNLSVRVDSWYGPRDVKDDPNATKFHRGIDINFGGGFDDYGAPIVATHDGVVHLVKNSTSGNGGRRVIIRSADGSFQTSYFHLKTINVKEGDEVKEGQEIAELGASAFGSDTGAKSHMHYAIETRREDGSYQWFNPTDGKENVIGNIVDPQDWVTSNEGESGIEVSVEAVKDDKGKKVGTSTKYTNTGKNPSAWNNFINELLKNLSDPNAYGLPGKVK